MCIQCIQVCDKFLCMLKLGFALGKSPHSPAVQINVHCQCTCVRVHTGSSHVLIILAMRSVGRAMLFYGKIIVDCTYAGFLSYNIGTCRSRDGSRNSGGGGGGGHGIA